MQEGRFKKAELCKEYDLDVRLLIHLASSRHISQTHWTDGTALSDTSAKLTGSRAIYVN